MKIKVLKDAVATALYGVKAANGVLEISSRRGASGPMSISLSTQAGVTLRGRQTTTMMDTDEKLELERRMQVTTAPGYLFSPDFISSATLSDLRQSYQSILGIARRGRERSIWPTGAGSLIPCVRSIRTGGTTLFVPIPIRATTSACVVGAKM